MVAGAAIDEMEVAAFLEDAALVVSHHADFDRPFCERLWPTFASLEWACSLRDIDWHLEGFEGQRLSQIAAGFGFFFDAHRATDDCLAGVEILSRRLPRSGQPVFAALLDSARRASWRVWAEGAPYQLRGKLKRRRYRWNSGEDGGIRAWFVDVPEDALEDELRFLRREIYGRDDVEIMRRRMTALERYSERC
jgi:DNA polymerase-3 subunit epsilon